MPCPQVKCARVCFTSLLKLAADPPPPQVLGVGGHAAMPHLATDPVVGAAALVTAQAGILAL